MISFSIRLCGVLCAALFSISVIFLSGGSDIVSSFNASAASRAFDDPETDLSVSKSVDSETVSAGSNVTYTITVAAAGPNEASNVTLSDPLPAGLTYVSLTQNSGPAFSCNTPNVGDNGTVTCTLASFDVGESATFTLVANVPSATAPGTFFTNIATVSTDTIDVNDENNRSSATTVVPTPSADLHVSKTVNSNAATAGTDLIYTITLRNVGSNAANKTSLEDTLPGDLTFVSLTQNSGPAFSCDTPDVGDNGTVTCTLASFAAGASATFTLVAHIPAGASEGTEYTNIATATTDTQDSNEENNSANVTTTIVTCLTEPFVNSNADSGPGSLRQAIQEACTGSTITFAAGLNGPIALTSGELLIDKNLTIQGPGANLLTVQRSAAGATPQFRIFNINSGATVTISGLTLTNGNMAGPGGGIHNSGALTLTNTSISGNSATDGGGIYNLGGTLTITNSTISGNTANSGGGIFVNSLQTGSTLNLINSTVSGNSATGNGGGLITTGSANLTSVTITNNRANSDDDASGSGGAIYINAGTPLLRNTIVAGNFRGSATTADDIGGSNPLDSASSYNLFGTGGAGGLADATNNNQVGVADPGLGSLADNGGPTMTHLLLPASPAIDRGRSFGLNTDQRGLPRPIDLNNAFRPNAAEGDGADIGAVEANYQLNATAGTPQSTPAGTTFAAQLQATFTESGRPIPGVTVTFDAPVGGASGTFLNGNTAVTDANGLAAVTFRANSTPGSYNITASIAGVVPASFSLTNLATGAIQFSAAAFEQDEGGGTAVISVTRAGGSAGATSINFSASAGTANGGAACSAGVDFVNTSGTLSWPDGDSAIKTFSVQLCDDSSNEDDETVSLTLSDLSGTAALGAQTTAVLTIRDNDPKGGRIEFVQSLYTVAERGGSRSITLRRTGDTTRAASVAYTTDDGSIPSVAVPCSSTTGAALERCDFTRSAGTLRFAAGQTEGSFNVLVNDDSYTEGTETLALRLSNPGGDAVLGPQSTATLEITDDAPESAGNPVDEDEAFVRQHYRDFLNREPDASGLKFWVDGIRACGADEQCREVKRINTSAAFFLSIEFQETGCLVHRLYKTAFGEGVGTASIEGVQTQIRVPVVRLNEFLPDSQAVGLGVVVGAAGWPTQLENNKTAFTREFVSRTRFTSAFPQTLTPEQFVDALDANAGGVLSATERANLVNELTANNTNEGRASVLRKVAEDASLAAAEKNRAFVLMQYFGYLRRNPDDAPDTNYDGYNFWLTKLEAFQGNFIRAEMVKAFINSFEYRQRFGQ